MGAPLDDRSDVARHVPHLAESIGVGGAGIAVLSTARLRWIGDGAGSTLNGQELADSLRNGVLVPDGGAWVAAAMYTLVALGGLLLASSGFAGSAVATARLVTGLVVVAPLLAAAIAGWFPVDRWSFGPSVIVAAGGVCVAVSARQLARARRTLSAPSRA